ncbi:MAG: phosphate ABC transporter permease PstA [bacterium]
MGGSKMGSPSDFRKLGTPFVWESGSMLILVALMVFGMILLILVNGLRQFWPAEIARVELKDGSEVIGEVMNREPRPQTREERLSGAPARYRTRFKVGNRDIYGSGADFRWVNDDDILSWEYPPELVCFQRVEYGNMYGAIEEISTEEGTFPGGGPEGLRRLWREVEVAWANKRRISSLEEEVERIRRPALVLHREIDIRTGRLRAGLPESPDEIEELQKRLEEVERELEPLLAEKLKELDVLYELNSKRWVVVALANGQKRNIYIDSIVRAYRPNAMSLPSKVGQYIARLWEFVSSEPRESNTEGGVFPALFGTVLMVMIMTVAVVPMGVLAALYLHEYAGGGLLVRAVRLAVSNLAGVPSIVFGVFGLGFFVYFVGGGIDRFFFSDRLPTPTFGTGGILWASLTLALLTVPVVVVATEEGLSAVPTANREGALALGATKFQMIWNVVLPNAMPGILTGMILAISRGAGEVAPLMITGVVKLAPSLPIDGIFPFLHLDRKFMHLGFHIYDVGFQSPNVEAAKPMVYSTALLLIFIVLLLNAAAIVIRNRLRRKYRGAAV